MKLITQGRRGQIFLDEKKQIAIKKAKDKNKVYAINKERLILLRLKEANINFVPKIIDWGEGWFSYKRIPGITMYDMLKKYEKNMKKIGKKLTGKSSNNIEYFSKLLRNFSKTFKIFRKNLFLDLLKKAYILDRLGIIHGELIRPYKNIIIKVKFIENKSKIKILSEEHKKILTKNCTQTILENFLLNKNLDNLFNQFSDQSLYIIDFERGKIGNYNGKNIKSYAQFLLSQGILTIHETKKIGKLSIKEIYKILKEKILQNC